MTKVMRRTNEPIGFLLKRFKRAVERSGQFREMRDREHYVKPSEIRRRKRISKLRAKRFGDQQKY